MREGGDHAGLSRAFIVADGGGGVVDDTRHGRGSLFVVGRVPIRFDGVCRPEQIIYHTRCSARYGRRRVADDGFFFFTQNVGNTFLFS